MKEEKLDEILRNQEQIKQQNKKIINVLTGNTADIEYAYEDIKQKAKKSPFGITRKQAARELDIHPNNVGRHFDKIAEENENFHVAEHPKRRGNPEILVHNEMFSKPRSESKMNLENNPMLQ